MKLIQPLPVIDSSLSVPREQRLKTSLPLVFVKYRYPHHASPSGYDRLCDYIQAPTIRIPPPVYWAGETFLRPFCIWHAKYGGKREYSRHDCVMEIEFLRRALFCDESQIYHFVYAEKSFHLAENLILLLKSRGHKLVGTVHHSDQQMNSLFRSLKHFRFFDLLLTMDQDSVPFWQGVIDRNDVFCVPHGIDTDFFHPIQHKSSPVVPRILFAGSHQRDFETLDRVISSISKTHDYKFDLIGKSVKLDVLKRKYPQTVKVYKRVSDKEYRSLMQNASVLLLPLLNSTTCNVVLESLACGTPVATTKGGISTYLDPGSSRSYRPGDHIGLLSGIRELCIEGEAARKSARKQALKYSWMHVAQMHLDILRSH